LLRAQHVFEMDAVEGRVAHAEHKLAAFFEHNVSGTGDEVVAQTVGDSAERAHRAGNHEHGINGVAAGGDGSANVSVGKHFNFRGRATEKAARELLGIARSDVQLFGEEALTRFGDDKMYAAYASVSFKQIKRLLREERAACAGHTNGYDLFV